ncbi:MAG TPA: helical backbone metal receptor [Gaiellaceae bacterium]|nr:helical backbone metal receptor [Gaiellaceae bacterium]
MVTITRAGALALATLLLFAASAAAKPTGYPVSIKTASGTVTLAAQPTRIVSLSPTATEDLFAIGAGSQVVAVDSDSNYPANAPITKLSAYTPNAEAIAGYKPDLVIASYDTHGLVASLQKLKIPVLLQGTAASLTDAYSQINQLGAATGRTAAATALVAKMKTQIASIARTVPKPKTPLTVYDELGTDYYSVTSKTFIGGLFKLLGLKDIADAADKTHSGYPQLSAEYIVAANPDLIVLSDTKCCGQTAAKVKARPGWSTIAALSNGGIVPMNDDIASRWGPRIVDFIRQIAAKVTALVKAGK